jgi:hypothetical protein
MLHDFCAALGCKVHGTRNLYAAAAARLLDLCTLLTGL